MDADWWSPDGRANAAELHVHRQGAFSALAELDAAGHRLLSRSIRREPVDDLAAIVGMTFLRRAVMQFTGVRHALYASLADPAKLLARALYETHLNNRYLVYGGRRILKFSTISSSHGREVRARYYMAGALRDEIYQRQALIDRVWARRPVSQATKAGMLREIAEREGVLKKLYRAQHQAYGPLATDPSCKRRRYYDDRKWYTFGFRKSPPKSLLALSKRLGMLDMYYMAYKPFSEMNHPVGLLHDLSIETTTAGILSPYVAEDFDTIVWFVTSWQTLTLLHSAKALSPESTLDLQGVNARVGRLTGDLQVRPILGGAAFTSTV